MSHWLDKVIVLLEADTSSLRELALLAGGDPRSFYLGSKMEDVDWSNQDLQGMLFTPRGQGIEKEARHEENFTLTLLGDDQYSNGNELASEEEWYLEWALSWKTASRDPELREAIAKKGEEWISRSPISIEWVNIWDQIWISERRKSPRRDRLFFLGLDRLSPNISRYMWRTIWKRLWKHKIGLNQVQLDSLATKTKDYIRSSDEVEFREIWKRLTQNARTSTLFMDLYIDVGLEWLSNADINHSRWASVWSNLWDFSSLPRNAIFELGVDWIQRADERHFGWAQVSLRLWQESEHLNKQGILIPLLEGWLDRNGDSEFFGYLWPELWKAAKSSRDQFKVDWLSQIGLRWLKRPRTTRYWASVWNIVWDQNGDPAFRKVLLHNAMIWLNSTLNKKEWPVVWERARRASEELGWDATAQLTFLSEKWFEVYPEASTNLPSMVKPSPITQKQTSGPYFQTTD